MGITRVNQLRAFFGLLFLLGCFATLNSVYGQGPPRLLSYQGILTNRLGAPFPDGDYTLTFRIYSGEVADTPLWMETKVVSTFNGAFETMLGDETSLTLEFDAPYWLGLQLKGEGEMAPRIPFVSTPYAMSAINAERAKELAPTAANVVHRLNGLDGSVTIVGTGLAKVTEAESTIRVDVPNPLPTGAKDGDILRWNAALNAWEGITLNLPTTALQTIQGEGASASPTTQDVVAGSPVQAYGSGTNSAIPRNVTVWVVDDNKRSGAGIRATLPEIGTNGQFLYVLYNDADNGTVAEHAAVRGNKFTFLYASGGWVLWDVN